MTMGWDADRATTLWWNVMTASDAWKESFRQQNPYSGSAQELHGKIQAEHFDYGIMVARDLPIMTVNSIVGVLGNCERWSMGISRRLAAVRW